MAWRERPSAVSAALAALALASTLAACGQTSRVDDAITPEKLTEAKKAVAVMRVGSSSAACTHAGVMLAQREQTWFKARQPIYVMNIRSVTEPAVAEVELDPGEYFVVAYVCHDGKRQVRVDDKGAEPQVYRTSLAHFTVAPGEIVNVGYLHVAARADRATPGLASKSTVTVTDWPLAELEQFKKKRPTIYAQMTTRLMQVSAKSGETGDDDCGRYRALQAEGKVQQLPAACTTPATSTATH